MIAGLDVLPVLTQAEGARAGTLGVLDPVFDVEASKAHREISNLLSDLRGAEREFLLKHGRLRVSSLDLDDLAAAFHEHDLPHATRREPSPGLMQNGSVLNSLSSASVDSAQTSLVRRSRSF
jgi:hypothetical protein